MNNDPSAARTLHYPWTFPCSEAAAFCFAGCPMHDTDNMAKKPELLVSIEPHSADIIYTVNSTFSL